MEVQCPDTLSRCQILDSPLRRPLIREPPERTLSLSKCTQSTTLDSNPATPSIKHRGRISIDRKRRVGPDPSLHGPKRRQVTCCFIVVTQPILTRSNSRMKPNNECSYPQLPNVHQSVDEPPSKVFRRIDQQLFLRDTIPTVVNPKRDETTKAGSASAGHTHNLHPDAMSTAVSDASEGPRLPMATTEAIATMSAWRSKHCSACT
mmetsp:Transcript_2721/g.3726  ORF Transcript_2721/g.3726 Transcript_2721/m.3726 type:complete len:205 (+) Transcript_2721:1842-2456(+)